MLLPMETHVINQTEKKRNEPREALKNLFGANYNKNINLSNKRKRRRRETPKSNKRRHAKWTMHTAISHSKKKPI